MPEMEEKIALLFERPVVAGALEEGQIVVVDGHVVGVEPDADDPERVRVTIFREVAGVGDEPDQRVVLTVPRDMKLATARRYYGTPPIHGDYRERGDKID